MSDNITLPREVIERLVASWGRDTDGFYGSMDFLRTALAAPEPEPVAWMFVNLDGECEQIEYGTPPTDDDSITPLYTAPPAAAPSEDIEALRRDAEKWRKAQAKYIAWQKGGKAEAMEDKT